MQFKNCVERRQIRLDVTNILFLPERRNRRRAIHQAGESRQAQARLKIPLSSKQSFTGRMVIQPGTVLQVIWESVVYRHLITPTAVAHFLYSFPEALFLFPLILLLLRQILEITDSEFIQPQDLFSRLFISVWDNDSNKSFY